MATLESLREELKVLIIESLELEDMAPADIGDNDALFNEGVGLDSIDALELGMAIAKKYGVKLSQNQDENRAYFRNVTTLAQYVLSQLPK